MILKAMVVCFCKYAFAHFILKAMVVERNDFWFMDDGALTYHICEVKTKLKRKRKKTFCGKTYDFVTRNTRKIKKGS